MKIDYNELCVHFRPIYIYDELYFEFRGNVFFLHKIEFEGFYVITLPKIVMLLLLIVRLRRVTYCFACFRMFSYVSYEIIHTIT